METFKPTTFIGGKAMLLASACLTLPLAVSQRAIAQTAAELEVSRRSASVQEARELLIKGDEAYLAGRYDEAVEAFAGARELLPDAPVTAELRAAATDRFAQASVEQARELSRKGDVAGARATVDKVLNPNVSPNDPGALAFRAQLDDPIRTNPAVTAEHAKDVDQVRRLLYTADGAYNLGKFDEAKSTYENVLRIDPTNTAARRGMEKTASAKTGYHQAAYDATRAEMLSQVGAAWETQIEAPDLGFGPEDPGGSPSEFGEVTVAARIKQFIVPQIALDQATLGEAIDYLRSITQQSGGESINFAINLGPPDSAVATRIRNQKFDLRLSSVPLSEVLKHITDITGTTFKTDEFSVIISPVGSTSDELITRSYRVKPDFFSNISTGTKAANLANTDPFSESAGSSGLLTSRLSAQEALTNQGISFPEGASASYMAASNTLRVINTAANQEIVDQLIQTINQTEPVTISVKVTIINTSQTNLEELGFDTLVTPFNIDGGDSLSASGGTVGSSPGRTAADFNPIIGGLPTDPTAAVSSGVISNGLRSGDQAITQNSIDGLVGNLSRDSQSSSVAPGILSLTGLFSEGDFQLMMRGLDQKKGVDIMARPSVVTRSGQSSSIVIAREFIYPTEYEPPELPNAVGGGSDGSFPVTPATPTAFETKDLGITLEILPVADANKRYIDITLNPSITDFDGFVNYGSPITTTTSTLLGTSSVELTQNAILMPVFSNQQATTQLTVLDGSTIAFGGLLSQSIQDVQDSVPILGDIPIVGRLFQSKARQSISTAIVFLVQVELLDPTGRPYRDR